MDRKRARFQDNPWRSIHRLEPVGHGGASRAPAELAQDQNVWGHRLRLFLIQKYVLGKMPAEEVTLISYFHTHSGGCGVEDLALHPSRSSGWADHVDLVVGKEFDLPELYRCPVPVFTKQSCTRESIDFPVYLPSRSIGQIVQSEPQKNDDELDASLFSPYFWNHPVTIRAREQGLPLQKIRPVALYWDGVAYNKKQTFIAMYLTDIISGEKHLVFVIRVGFSVLL